MNKEWLDKVNGERNKMLECMENKIRNEISFATFFTDDFKKKVLSYLDEFKRDIFSYRFECEMSMACPMPFVKNSTSFPISYEEYQKWLESLDIETYCKNMQRKNIYDRYLDSDPKEFDGDIIITDPCYIIKEDDDWDTCEYGDNMEAIGIHTHITRDTLYGDWSCTTYDSDTDESIGEFCADAGLVSVFLLDEVLKYNPGFDYHINKPWTTTLIKDFKGIVQFIVFEREYVHEEDYEGYWKKGEKYLEYEVEVHGHGVNKVTGEPVNFVGKQTGL